MRILIATGIYPPEIGGPALYAFHLEQEFKKLGHEVRVIKFSSVRWWPTGIRHLVYFFKIFAVLPATDFVLVLDTFSVALPTVAAAKLFGTRVVMRIGGDFLWENYVERTGKLVLFKNFYLTEQKFLNFKERLVFALTRWIVRSVSCVAFTTDWQRQIWREPYSLDLQKTKIIENYYGEKAVSFVPEKPVFLVAGRDLKLKNLKILKDLPFVFEIGRWSQEILTEKIKQAYVLLVPSLSDISPNIVLEAIRYNKPFVLTQETGIRDRIGDVGVYVNPLDPHDIAEKLRWLGDKNNYRAQVDKVMSFDFEHAWSAIAREFIRVQA